MVPDCAARISVIPQAVTLETAELGPFLVPDADGQLQISKVYQQHQQKPFELRRAVHLDAQAFVCLVPGLHRLP